MVCRREIIWTEDCGSLMSGTISLFIYYANAVSVNEGQYN